MPQAHQVSQRQAAGTELHLKTAPGTSPHGSPEGRVPLSEAAAWCPLVTTLHTDTLPSYRTLLSPSPSPSPPPKPLTPVTFAPEICDKSVCTEGLWGQQWSGAQLKGASHIWLPGNVSENQWGFPLPRAGGRAAWRPGGRLGSRELQAGPCSQDSRTCRLLFTAFISGADRMAGSCSCTGPLAPCTAAMTGRQAPHQEGSVPGPPEPLSVCAHSPVTAGPLRWFQTHQQKPRHRMCCHPTMACDHQLLN